MAQKGRLWTVLLATGLGVAMLVALGLWQVQRLQWKQDLMARLAASQELPAIGPAQAERLLQRGEMIEFVKIATRGQFLNGDEKHLISVYEGGPAWTIVTPLVTADGLAILVDRGVVPDGMLDKIERPGDEVEVTGIARIYSGRQGLFAPNNDAAQNRWYWWDVNAMGMTTTLPDGVSLLPFVLQVVPASAAAAFPRPQPPRANLTNNHLGYAITWFSLAAALVVVAGLFLRSRAAKTTA